MTDTVSGSTAASSLATSGTPLGRDDDAPRAHRAECADVAVVIVNWNTAHLIDDCLDSVTKALPAAEIVVVDNGSTDDSLAVLARWPRVTVVANDQNVGYQAACNQGTRATVAELLLHINTDARVLPGTVAGLLSVLERRPDVGVVGPRLVYGDNTFQRWTAGQRPSYVSLAVSFLLGDRFGTSGHGLWIGSDEPLAHEVGWVSSACLMLRRSLFDAMGGLDEQFFAYMDDVDLGVAARDLGWLVWYQPLVTAVHLMGGSQEHPGSAASPTAIRALITWCRRRSGRPLACYAAVVMATGFIARAAAHALRSIVRRERSESARRHITHARIALSASRKP